RSVELLSDLGDRIDLVGFRHVASSLSPTVIRIQSVLRRQNAPAQKARGVKIMGAQSAHA
ncbi:hypothetical protein, partial [Saccharopolyspora sp. NPDC002686]|uniref:hypothetical protein n=1 Tax=Saccharopolyspora sp. NPDC002686 TaxID=3154541 RepID=UPI00331C5A56